MSLKGYSIGLLSTRDIRMIEAQSPAGSVLTDQAKCDQRFSSLCPTGTLRINVLKVFPCWKSWLILSVFFRSLTEQALALIRISATTTIMTGMAMASTIASLSVVTMASTSPTPAIIGARNPIRNSMMRKFWITFTSAVLREIRDAVPN